MPVTTRQANSLLFRGWGTQSSAGRRGQLFIATNSILAMSSSTFQVPPTRNLNVINWRGPT